MIGQSGDKNPRAKLTLEHVKLLRMQYRKNRRGRLNRSGHGQYSRFSTASLAEEYEVAQSTMWSALTGKSWRDK